MRKFVVGIVCLAMLASWAQAAVIIIESRVSGGGQNPLYTQNGPAITSAKSTAAGLSGTGSYYAGDTTPVKWGQWAFTPATGQGGYYNVFATWANYATPGGCDWVVNHAGGAYANATLQQTGSNGNAWQKVNGSAALLFNAGTAYATRLNTIVAGTSGKRVYFDSIKWESVAPGAPTNTGPGNGATDVELDAMLTWNAGQYNSFFDVFVEANNSNPSVKVGSNLAAGTTSLDPGDLLPSTTYYWKVVAKNVDQSASGAVWSFTTTPDPATLVLMGLGGLMFIRRRRSA